MKQVAEIMYIVESERDEFLRGALQMEEETQVFLYQCGVRNQQYFALNEFIFMTFMYVGDNFKEDMFKMSSYLDSKGHLIKKRRKDVPVEERTTTNWWAPVKKLGTLLEDKPKNSLDEDGIVENYMASDDGGMSYKNSSAYQNYDTSFDEDEWMEDLQIWKNL